MKHNISEYDYFFNFRGKKYRVFCGGLLWWIMTFCGACFLAICLFGFIVATAILMG